MATQSVTGNPSRWLPVRCSGRSYSNQLSAIGIAHTHPGVAHLLVVHHRIVDQDVETEPWHREGADRRQQSVRSHDAVVLGGDQGHAGIHELLLRVRTSSVVRGKTWRVSARSAVHAWPAVAATECPWRLLPRCRNGTSTNAKAVKAADERMSRVRL